MTRITITAIMLATMATSAMAQSANTDASVGPGGAGASAGANGSIWQHAETDTRSGSIDIGRGLAIGVGPNGLSVSHSIAAGKGPLSVGHNINMTIGQNGTHVSQGGVIAGGGQTSVGVGGSTQGGPNLNGGSVVTGNGWNTHAWSDANTRHRYYPSSGGTVTMPMTSRSMPIRATNTVGMPVRNTGVVPGRRVYRTMPGVMPAPATRHGVRRMPHRHIPSAQTFPVQHQPVRFRF